MDYTAGHFVVIQNMNFQIYEARLFYPYVGAEPQPGEGLLLLASGAESGFPALLLVLDEGTKNKGVSATNSLVSTLNWVQRHWPKLGLGSANILQYDSEGYWDHVHPTWVMGEGELAREVTSINWSPVKWPCAPHRSFKAARAMFGTQIEGLLGHARRTTNFTPVVRYT